MDFFNIEVDFFQDGGGVEDPLYEKWRADLLSGKTRATSIEAYKGEQTLKEQKLKQFYDADFSSGATKLPWELYKQSFIGQVDQMGDPGTNPTNYTVPGTPPDINEPAPSPLPEETTLTQEERYNQLRTITGQEDPFSYSPEFDDEGSVMEQTPETERPSFLQYALGTPGLGMSIPLEDKFMIAGQSFAFDPSYMGDDERINKRAKRVANATGVAALTSGLLGATRGYLTGRGLAKRQNQMLSGYYDDFRNYGVNNYRFQKDGGWVFEDGGMLDIPFEKMMTDEYAAGLPPALEYMANAEVEKDEYLRHPSGKVQQVLGRTHEKGGEKMFLQPSTKIISDNLTMGSTQAKECGDHYDLKLKSSDTYADAIDKYAKKIGLDDVQEELEGYYKKLEKLDNIKDESTKAINLDFIKKKIAETEKNRQGLLEQRKTFVDYIFKKQEQSKIEKYEDGGLFKGSNIDALARKHGLTKEQVMEILPLYEKGGKMKRKMYYQEGGEYPASFKSYKDKKRNQEFIAPEGITPEQFYNTPGLVEYMITLDRLEGVDNDLGKADDSVWGYRHQQAYERFFKNPEPVTNPVVAAQEDVIKATEQSPIIPLAIKNRMKRSSALLVPGAFNLPPEGMLPHAKRELRAEMVDPMAISPDENLREIFRMVDMNNDALDYLPLGMRSGVNATNTAAGIEGANKAITAANQYNAANRQQTEQVNVQGENIVRMFTQNEIPRYEQLQLTAVDKTLNDYHEYFNTQYNNQLARYNYITSAGIIDSMFDNVGFDPYGRPEVDTETFIPFTSPFPTR